MLVAAGCSSPSPRGDDTATVAPTTVHTDGQLTVLGPRRSVPDRFFGFNGASIVQSVNVDLLLSEDLQRRLADFPVPLIRVPTGTAAQWIDWRTGAFIEDDTSPFASIPADRRGVRMQDWARLVDTIGATPVWDLNVLNADLDDQIAMLDAARRLGMPIEYIELGNELWDIRSIYPEVFPTGTDYAARMNRWIPELRARFPDARIAVCGADPSDPFFSSVFGDRYRNWNTEVLATIRDADAITIHPYWTLPGRANPGSDVPATLAAGLESWEALRATTLARLPDGMGVWVTEWNQAAWGSRAGTQIWAQALSVAAVALEQLVDPRIEMSLVHDIVDGEPNPHDAGVSITFPSFTNGALGSEPLQRTALGHVLPVLFDAIGSDAVVTPVGPSGTPRPPTPPGFTGVVVSGANPGAVFVNLSGEAVQIETGSLLPGRWSATVLDAPPDAAPGWNPHDTVHSTTTEISTSVELPPYGLLRLSAPER